MFMKPPILIFYFEKSIEKFRKDEEERLSRLFVSLPDQRFTANVREEVDGRGNEHPCVRGTARTRG